MLRFLIDPANAITIAGLLFSALGFHLVLAGSVELGVAAVLWAALADDLDGIVAARTSNRSPDVARMGKSLDGFADIVYGAVFPAVVLIQLSDASYLSLAAAMLLLSAGALRLSYFSNFGLSEDGRFLGVPLFYDVPLLAAFLLARPLIPPESFPVIVNMTFVILGCLHVASIRIPATRGRMYVVTTGLIVAASLLLITGELI